MPNDYINQVNINGTDYDVVLGNIQKDGTLQSSDITIASGDKLVVTDSSGSNKVARTSLSFGADTTKYLRNDGTWQTVSTDDTKNTAGATDTSSKIYLVGALSQTANPQTYTHDTVYVNTSGQLVASTPVSTTNNTTVATTAFVKAQGYTSNTGTVTSVGLTNATNGGLSITGSPVTGSGSITVGHTNILTSSQTTQAIYPITIDKNGHIASYGSAYTAPEEVYVVNVTLTGATTGTADKSASEIYTAASSGKVVVVKVPYVVGDLTVQMVAPLSHADNDDGTYTAIFEYHDNEYVGVSYARLVINNSKAVTLTMYSSGYLFEGGVAEGGISLEAAQGLTLLVNSSVTNTAAAVNNNLTYTFSAAVSDIKVDNNSIIDSSGIATINTSPANPYTIDNPIATMADIGAAGGGTVTNVSVVNSGGLSITGSPITSAGTINIGHVNSSITAQTTQAVYPIKIDTYGHITSYGTAVTIPTAGTTTTAVSTVSSAGTSTSFAKADHVHNLTSATISTALGFTPLSSYNDTKVTNTLATTTKYYVTGTTSNATNTGTQSFDTGVYVTTTAGQLNATTYKVNDSVTMQWNSTDSSLDFVF